MKILILGAGATGGYFGGRLTAAGQDVIFLVRDKRARQLAAQGLVIESPFGNLTTPVNAAVDPNACGVHDVVILSCKSYDLDSAIATITPAMAPHSLVLPLLNGLKHLDALDAAFGKARVLGGSCHLSVALGEDGVVRHLNRLQLLTFGPRVPAQAARCEQLNALLQTGGFDVKLRADVDQAMWDKWVLLASLAGLTCLFRASVGDIARAPGGASLMHALIEECRRVAAANGFEPAPAHIETVRGLLTDPSSKVVASMLRDMQKGARIEADLIIGDMLRRAAAARLEAPLLSIANANLACYENALATGHAPP